MTHNALADKQETDSVNSIQDLTLESNPDTQNLTDIPAPPPDVPEVKCKGEDRTNEPLTTPTYEKYRIYMSTFGYEGEDSNLDSKMDSDSNVMAYLYLE